MKIVFLDIKTLGDVPNLQLLEQFGELVIYETSSYSQTINRVAEADIIITNKAVIDRHVINHAPQLKLICVSATGTNNIDKAAAAELGIPVKNVVDYSSRSVAQLTFALVLQLINKVSYFNNYVKQGAYAQSDIFTHLGKNFWEIHGKRYGIIGLGNIGRQVAGIAQAFGAEIVYYSTSGHNNNQPYQQLDLEEFLNTVDIISIHAPLNEQTQNLINYERLSKMKRSALLINVGRGGIINELDLARALDEKLIAGAGIDAFEQEPIEPGNPSLHIKNTENLVLTPHIAWASIEARTLLVEKVYQNIREFIGK